MKRGIDLSVGASAQTGLYKTAHYQAQTMRLAIDCFPRQRQFVPIGIGGPGNLQTVNRTSAQRGFQRAFITDHFQISILSKPRRDPASVLTGAM